MEGAFHAITLYLASAQRRAAVRTQIDCAGSLALHIAPENHPLAHAGHTHWAAARDLFRFKQGVPLVGDHGIR
jgi:hypothetical protein